MAKISRKIDDLEKIIEKAHQTPKERIKNIDEEIKLFESVKFQDIEETTLKRQEILQEARKILIEQIEEEETKKELEKIKHIEQLEKRTKKEIEKQLFYTFKRYFEEFPHKRGKVSKVLKQSDVITEEVAEITKKWGSEFEMFTFSIYNKVLNKVINIYKEDIKQQEQTQKTKNKSLIDEFLGVALFGGLLSSNYKSIFGRRR